MLGYVDYIVLTSTLLISSAIGIYYRRQNTAKDYLLAGGSMTPLPVAFSLMASFMSAITLLGVTFENYTFGTQFVGKQYKRQILFWYRKDPAERKGS